MTSPSRLQREWIKEEEQKIKKENEQTETASIIEDAITYKPKKIKELKVSEKNEQKEIWEKPRSNATVWSILRKAKDKGIKGNPYFEERFLQSDEIFVMYDYAVNLLQTRWNKLEEWVENKYKISKKDKVIHYRINWYIDELFKEGDRWEWLETAMQESFKNITQYDEDLEVIIRTFCKYVNKTKRKQQELKIYLQEKIRWYLYKIVSLSRKTTARSWMSSKEAKDFDYVLRNSFEYLENLDTNPNEKIDTAINYLLASSHELICKESLNNTDLNDLFTSEGVCLEETARSFHGGMVRKIANYFIKTGRANNNIYYDFLKNNYQANIYHLFNYCCSTGNKMTEEQLKYFEERYAIAFEKGARKLEERIERGHYTNGHLVTSVEILSYIRNCTKSRWLAYEDLLIKHANTKGAKEYAKTIIQLKKENEFVKNQA